MTVGANRLMVKNRIRLAMLVLVLVAFALRVHRLDYQALRGNEAFAHLFAQQPLGEMLPSLATIEPHPPLYYATLHLWTSLLGQSEFAARFWSAALGAGTITGGHGRCCRSNTEERTWLGRHWRSL